MIATWFVMEDGSVADPSEVRRDAAGVLRHRDGRAVAMRDDVPRSRSVDADAERAKQAGAEKPTRPKKRPDADKADDPAGDSKAMKPDDQQQLYKTRESKAD